MLFLIFNLSWQAWTSSNYSLLIFKLFVHFTARDVFMTRLSSKMWHLVYLKLGIFGRRFFCGMNITFHWVQAEKLCNDDGRKSLTIQLKISFAYYPVRGVEMRWLQLGFCERVGPRTCGTENMVTINTFHLCIRNSTALLHYCITAVPAQLFT